MNRIYNQPNWYQPVTSYRPGSPDVLSEFEIGQVWDGSVEGHRRLRRLCLETIEALRDAHGFEYILWSPILHGGRAVPLADRGQISVG